MKKSYYLFNPGRMSRKDNTFKFEGFDEEGQKKKPKYLPIEGIDDLYVFGSIEANSAMYNFLGKQKIPVHFFDYYEHYTGSFMPKEFLLAGKMQVLQTQFYSTSKKRIILARSIIEAAVDNMQRVLKYYAARDRDVKGQIAKIEGYQKEVVNAQRIDELMGLEGNVRQVYYSAFNAILNDFEMNGRNRQPPKDPVNALISFGNMICYTTCLDQIYHTQLNPTISFLHEPGFRRYSLALDLAEIFKPIFVDRTIFSLLNKKEIRQKDFDVDFNKCLMSEKARKKFMEAYDKRLKKTIKHPDLNKEVSYKRLVRLECYKLQKHILGIRDYQGLKFKW